MGRPPARASRQPERRPNEHQEAANASTTPRRHQSPKFSSPIPYPTTPTRSGSVLKARNARQNFATVAANAPPVSPDGALQGAHPLAAMARGGGQRDGPAESRVEPTRGTLSKSQR